MRSTTKLCTWILALSAAGAQAADVQGVRLWAGPEGTRVVLDLAAPVTHQLFMLDDPERVVIDIDHATWAAAEAAPTGVVRAVRHGNLPQGGLRIVLDLTAAVQPRSFLVAPNDVYGHRLVLDLAPAQPAATPAVVRAAPPPDDRAVVVAIDAGHGGEDPGALGRHGTREKDVSLAVARALARLIAQTPDLKPALVRDGDYSVSLRRRMEIARADRADLFVSIHADAFRDARAHGASVYVLSERGASSEAARWLAERENAADLIGGVSLDDKDDLLASVLLDLSQTATLSASMQVGAHVLEQLRQTGDLHGRDVQQAGFIVLKSPDIPSILVETAYISNPQEEKRLSDPHEQQRLAVSILAGIRSYFLENPPAGTRLAERAAGGRLRYNVLAGDTLSGIADRFQVSIAELRNVNALDNDRIHTGQVLAIPLQGH
jgi:N-acetylmuramoyl-L-alanine amidase